MTAVSVRAKLRYRGPMRLLAICALVFVGCIHNEPGAVLINDENPVVTIGGGFADMGGGSEWRVFYYVDRRTQLCAMQVGVIGGPVSCCNVWRMKEARPHLKWLSAEACARPDAG